MAGEARGVKASSEETKRSGKFVFPGLCMIKLRRKEATQASKRELFGKVVQVKATPASCSAQVS